MSAPARKLHHPPAARPARTPGRSAGRDASTPRRAPTRTPAAHPPTSSPPSLRRRARRGSTPAFWIFTFVIVTALVVGIVSISAMLVSTSFQEDELRSRLVALADEREGLVRDAAGLSSPARVQAWARADGMVMPDQVVTLPVRSSPTGGSSG
ncbi:MAG: hypothetical protein ACXWXS_04790 [Actinomycetota bacterium]